MLSLVIYISSFALRENLKLHKMRAVLSNVMLGKMKLLTRDTSESFREWVPAFTNRVFHTGRPVIDSVSKTILIKKN